MQVVGAREAECTATTHLFGVFVGVFNVINQVQKQEHQSSFCCNKTELSSQAGLIHIPILILLYNIKAF